jgi:hypothetical protein
MFSTNITSYFNRFMIAALLFTSVFLGSIVFRLYSENYNDMTSFTIFIVTHSVLAFLGFVFIGNISYKVYSWNNGTCRQTDLPWLEHLNIIEEDRVFFSKGQSLEISHFFTINYNHEKAIFRTENYSFIKNIKNFN